MQCCALKQRAVAVLSLYLQSASPYPRKTGMEARDLGRVRLHILSFAYLRFSYRFRSTASAPDSFWLIKPQLLIGKHDKVGKDLRKLIAAVASL